MLVQIAVQCKAKEESITGILSHQWCHSVHEWCYTLVGARPLPALLVSRHRSYTCYRRGEQWGRKGKNKKSLEELEGELSDGDEEYQPPKMPVTPQTGPPWCKAGSSGQEKIPWGMRGAGRQCSDEDDEYQGPVSSTVMSVIHVIGKAAENGNPPQAMTDTKTYLIHQMKKRLNPINVNRKRRKANCVQINLPG